MSTERLDRLLPVIVCAAATLIAIAVMGSWPVGAYQDDAMYVVLAKALASGEGYRYLSLPGHPAATHFPPGYPAFLAALWTIAPRFPGNVALFTAANAVFYGLAAAGLYHLARSRFALGRGVAFGVTALGMLVTSVLGLAGLVMSEPMYLALLVPVLVICDRAVERGDWRAVGAAALACAALAMVRSIGVIALAALFIALLVGRRYRAAGVAAAVGVIALLPWKIWMMAHGDALPALLVGEYGSYDGWLMDGVRSGGVEFVWRVVSMNLRDIATVLVAPNNVDGARAVSMNPARIGLACAMAVLAVVGVVRAANRSRTLALYVVAYVLLILIWPFEPTRFARALWPLLVLVMCLGAMAILSASSRRLRLPLAAALAIIPLVHLMNLAQSWARRDWESFPRSWALPTVSQVQWVEENTRPDDVVMSDRALSVYLYTGRYAVPPADFQTTDRVRPPAPDRLQRTIRTLAQHYDARYILLYNAHAIAAASPLAIGAEPSWRFLNGRMTFGTVLAKTAP
ncbi:MAG TPA: hypothetical protein VLE53_02680 [Gemmatimonadaceae bacterium]|nr:hypothetical protein [Gemmatimonadaceae bacterium]